MGFKWFRKPVVCVNTTILVALNMSHGYAFLLHGASAGE